LQRGAPGARRREVGTTRSYRHVLRQLTVGWHGGRIVRWYPAVQWFDGDGLADLLRSTSLYRRLDSRVRDPLLDAIAERIRTQMGDRASRRYLSVLRAGRRAE
jgi:hypothetical protein